MNKEMENGERHGDGGGTGNGKRVHRLVANRAQDKVSAREAHCLGFPINPHLRAASVTILITKPLDLLYQ